MKGRLLFYFFIVASVLLYELLNGIYIYLGIDFTESYQFNLLFHIFIGLIFLIPFTLYQYIHFGRAQVSWSGEYRVHMNRGSDKGLNLLLAYEDDRLRENNGH